MDANAVPSPSAIREQVERLRASLSFAGSDRLMALLDYVVEETLGGRSTGLRETAIGNAVYQRDPPYDPRVDSTVRVEARRLRKKLQEHFSSEGSYDPVIMTIPNGTYVPLFEANSADRASRLGKPVRAQDIFRSGTGTKVAVLPVRVISGGKEVEDFAIGLTDELILALGSEPGVRVSSRAMTFAYADRQPSIPSLVAELGLDAVVQGTVRATGKSLRVSVELSDPRGFVVASDRFESAAPDSEELAEHIATAFASRLRFDSSRMRAGQISPGPVAIDAHAKVYRARQMLDRQTPEGLREALTLFTDVAETAPDYARGHSGIADCHCDMYRIGMTDRETALAHARPAVERALEIDGGSAEAFTALGTIQAWLERDRDGAEASFEHALSIGRNARSARIFGSYLALLGMADDAERLFYEARAIEPFSQQQDIAEALSHFQARRFDEQHGEMAKSSAASLPAEALFYLALTAHFGGRDDVQEYAAPLARMRMSHPQLIFAAAELDAWRRGGRIDRTAATVVENPKASRFSHATLACALGQQDIAIGFLSQALDRRELASVWMRSDVRFDAIRNTPSFIGLLDRLDALRLS